MSDLGTQAVPAFPVDLGWRNVVFSVRTAAAAILALAVAFWLELSDPQWSALTVYLLAQPTAGAAVAKGAWRTVGTIAGGLVGLLLVGLFSQAAEVLVGAMAAFAGLTFYAGARLRNYASYGVLLAGYSALLVAYEGSSNPSGAWSIAADRIAEILIGIACITAVSTLILPRFAGDALRESLARTFSELAGYVATALRQSTPPDVFSQLRRRMVAEVVSFDALRSYTAFEAPEMRADEGALRRTVHEFLVVLSVSRGLFLRLENFRKSGAGPVLERLEPVLDANAARLERIAADPTTLRDPLRVRHELLEARVALDDAARQLESLAGQVPFDPLANGLLVLRRAGDLLHGLSMVIVTEAASVRTRNSGRPVRRRESWVAGSQREAVLIALRAALALVLMSAFWLATGWNEGFTAVSGGAIMLFFAVNQDNPVPIARSFVLWSSAGIAVAYAAMILVLPHLQGFPELALFLLLVLLPAGLMAGTPAHAWAGIALGGFIVSQIGTGNVLQTDESAFVNAAVALLLGMVGCLAVLAALPVTSQSRRGQIWERTMSQILPAVARGERPAREAAGEIVAALAALLPRLALDRKDDEEFFRGVLSAASGAIELGRLVAIKDDPATAAEAADVLGIVLARLADALESLKRPRAGYETVIAEAQATVAQARARLEALPLEPGTAEARGLLRAGASLRFISDRFTIDRAFLTRGFAGE